MVVPNEGMALEFFPVSVINGIKCAKLVEEDIEGEVAYWQNAVTCCVLAATPPHEVIAGYVRQIWHTLTVAQKGIYHFDQKPFRVKAWNPKMETNIDAIASPPIWIQLPELDIKYWGIQSLSKIGSMLGIPLKTDKYSKEKSMLKYVRLLVEMPLEGHFPDYVEFVNGKSVLIRQKVTYEWHPLKCSHCKIKQDNHRKEWRVRSQVHPQEQNQPSERVKSRGDDDFQLVTKHTTKHCVTRVKGQKESTTPNDLLMVGFLETKVEDQNMV
ncbi:hypothetical protein Cgig2_009218 [Carnegiea gigantea]|uniref:DUF4283 domain-containing protein n=1 Tax=Carnegiea gigantea TaxID=171969 RepID=A0A9Q1GHG7_9CARY|nr:hypothetical protein Cgig2_009218 [Carnegiea gigantea]